MSREAFSPTDARLLDLLQREFPLVPRPFEALAEKLGIAPQEVMDRIQRLKRDGIIRQISAIFDSAALGYTSSLVAFKTSIEMLDGIAERVSAHPGVSHCYSRDAGYNLWFTITVGPGACLDDEIRTLAALPGVIASLNLPTVKLLKIGVFLDVAGEGTNRENAKVREREKASFGSSDIAAVRALQRDLPIVEEPFAELSAAAAKSQPSLLAKVSEWRETGIIRRYAAVLRHTNAGFRANAMVCWMVDEDRIDEAGEALASHPSVSHCYQRVTYPDWPYPLYTMVHCRTEDELQRAIAGLSASSGLSDYRVLRTVKEYKKSRVTYFGQ